MTRSSDFGAAVRDGARARSGVVVVHQWAPSPSLSSASASASESVSPFEQPARVGLVVNKAVGGSVERHRVARRLRAQLADRLPALPAGSATVVRALPAAASADSAALGHDLDRALARLRRPGAR